MIYADGIMKVYCWNLLSQILTNFLLSTEEEGNKLVDMCKILVDRFVDKLKLFDLKLCRNVSVKEWTLAEFGIVIKSVPFQTAGNRNLSIFAEWKMWHGQEDSFEVSKLVLN